MQNPPSSLIAIDIGNSRAKLGRFDRAADCEAAAQAAPLPIAGPLLPGPAETLSLAAPIADHADALRAWLAENAPRGARLAVASVNREGTREILQAVENAVEASVVQLTAENIPIETSVEQPARVGVDRLLAGVAANRVRRAERAAIVVDLGTAITVDLITAEGQFAGGAILPGVGMSARALSEGTDALPKLPLSELDASPDAVGTNTTAAIEAGIYWGAVGAVRELIARQSDRLTEPPQVLVTGGAAPAFARLLGGPDIAVRFYPDLVLSGIAIASGFLGDGRP